MIKWHNDQFVDFCVVFSLFFAEYDEYLLKIIKCITHLKF